MEKEFTDKSIVFSLKFFVLFFFLYFLLIFFGFVFLQEFIAGIEAEILGIEVQGNLLFLKSGVFAITESCTGLVSSAILVSLIFSFKKPDLKKKALMAVSGTVVLLFANIVRIYFVLLSGKYFGVNEAELVHIVSWIAMSLLVIVLWYFSVKKISKIKNFWEML